MAFEPKMGLDKDMVIAVSIMAGWLEIFEEGMFVAVAVVLGDSGGDKGWGIRKEGIVAPAGVEEEEEEEEEEGEEVAVVVVVVVVVEEDRRIGGGG